MPKRWPTNDRNRERDTTPGRSLRERAFPTGVFRCDRCDRVVPDALRVEQDGYDLCRTLCADEMSVSDDKLRLAAQMSETDSYQPNDDPVTRAFADVTEQDLADQDAGGPGGGGPPAP